MWILSSPKKNLSDRGRIDVFLHGLNWILKASLLILALSSFSVASAASIFPEWCRDKPETCFAKTSDELDVQRDDIDFDEGEIIWTAMGESETPLYKYKECKKLSFSMDKPESDKNCTFSMLYHGCRMDIAWETKRGLFELTFYDSGKDGIAIVLPDSSVKVELEGGKIKCEPKECELKGGFCPFRPSQREDGYCKFNFTLMKTDSCEGTVRFDRQDYMLLVRQPPTTVSPETTSTTADYAKTTPDGEAAGLSPWIIAGIVVAVVLLVAACIIWICCRRCKHRRLAKRMAETGNAGSDYECETVVSSPTSLRTATRMNEEGRSSIDNAEGLKSGKKRKTKGTRRLHFQRKEFPKPIPFNPIQPVPGRRRKEDLYELLGEPIKPIQPAGEPMQPSAKTAKPMQPSAETAKPMQPMETSEKKKKKFEPDDDRGRSQCKEKNTLR